MLHRLIDDFRMASALAARRTFFVVAVAGSLFVTTCFLCAAAFVFVLERYGLVPACLAGAAIFFVVTLMSAGSYFALKQSVDHRVEEDTKVAAKSLTPDPAMLMAGIQIARAIGFKRIVPIAALGGLALALLAGRNATTTDQADV